MLGLLVIKRAWKLSFMAGPARYIVLDGTPQAKGLQCPADELADALRAPLAVVGVCVIRRRGTGVTVLRVSGPWGFA